MLFKFNVETVHTLKTDKLTVQSIALKLNSIIPNYASILKAKKSGSREPLFDLHHLIILHHCSYKERHNGNKIEINLNSKEE